MEGHGVNYNLAKTIGSLAPNTELVHSISTEKLGKKKKDSMELWRKIDQEDFHN